MYRSTLFSLTSVAIAAWIASSPGDVRLLRGGRSGWTDDGRESDVRLVLLSEGFARDETAGTSERATHRLEVVVGVAREPAEACERESANGASVVVSCARVRRERRGGGG